MSAREPSVLERNLRALLTRAYEPVVPRATFRLQLRADFDAHVQRRFGPRRAPVPRIGWSRLAAAALILFALGFLLRDVFVFGTPEGPDAILAGGRVAVRSEGQEWRSARIDPRSRSEADAVDLVEAPTYELRTPAGHSARVRHGELELRVEPGSSVAVRAGASDGAVVAVELGAGALELRVGAGESLPLVTPEGPLELAGVRLRAEQGAAPQFAEPGAGWVALTLIEGELRATVGDARRTLRAPRRFWLSAGRVHTEPRADPPPVASGAERRAVGFEPRVSAPAAATGDGEAEPVVLRGRVRGAPEAGADPGAPGPLLSSFEVILLEEKNLPDAALPVRFELADAGGRFALPPQSPGRYTLFVLADGHAVWKQAGLQLGAAPEHAEDVPRVEVDLERGTTVRGVVLRAADGAPVPNAVVLSESDAPVGVLPIDADSLEDFEVVRFVRTGPDGGFELRNVASGTQLLRASGGGLAATWTERFELEGPGPRDGIEIRLGEDGRVEGRVADEFGAPLPGQAVLASCSDFAERRPCLTYRHAITDADGNYSIEGMPGGVLAVLRFGSRESLGAAVAPDMRLTTVRPGGTSRVDFSVRAASPALAGVLVDESGAPVPGRAIWAMPDDSRAGLDSERWQSTSSQEDGSFRFPGLEPGTYQLYVTGRAPAELTSIGTVTHDAGAPRELRLVLGLARLAGQVRARADGSVPQDAAVLLLERVGADVRLVGKALVSRDGTFVIEDVPAGLYDLVAVAGGADNLAHGALESLAVVPGDRIEDLDFELAPGAAVEVEVRLGSPGGAPGAGARIEFFDAGGRLVPLCESNAADARGLQRVPGVALGSWTVEVSLAGYERARVAFDVLAPGAQRVPVVLLPRAR